MKNQYGFPTVELSYVGEKKDEKVVIKSAADAAKALRSTYQEGEMEMREYFKVLLLRRDNSVIGVHLLSMGGSDATVVDKKILFCAALLSHAAAIIVSHNHPSGNLKPSVMDDKMTMDIAQGCKVLGLSLLDHVILSEFGFYSYMDEGKL